MQYRSFDEHAFVSALRQAIIQSFQELQRHVASEQMYAYGLYTNGEGTYVTPTANTEEALLRRAQSYHANGGRDIALHQLSLRWSAADWEYHDFATDGFQTVDEILLQGWDEEYTTFYYDEQNIYQLCLLALKAVYAEGVFQQNNLGQQLTIILWMGDQSDEKRIEWAKFINPTIVVQRLERELDEGFQAYKTLTGW